MTAPIHRQNPPDRSSAENLKQIAWKGLGKVLGFSGSVYLLSCTDGGNLRTVFLDLEIVLESNGHMFFSCGYSILRGPPPCPPKGTKWSVRGREAACLYVDNC